MIEPQPPSPNQFEKDKPGTNAGTDAEARIEQLRQQGGIFVEAVKATRMPMAVTDARLPGNPIVFANHAFLELSGYNMGEVLGQAPHFMAGPDTDSEDARRFREAIERDEDIVLETWQYRKDGSRFCASVFCRPLFDAEGSPTNHFLSYLDITRRVEAEEEVRERAAAAERRYLQGQQALSEREETLRSALSVETVGIIFWGSDFRITETNDAFLAMSGFSHEEAIGLTWQELTPPEFHAASKRTVEELESKGVATPYEKQYFRKDGSRWWGVFAPRKTPGGALEVVIDVTDRKASDEALRRSEESYRLIVENATDYAILIVDPDDIIIEWMPGAEAVFGWTREEALGRPGGITFTAEDQAERQPEKEIATAAREGCAPDVRWHQRKDGSLVFIEGTVTPLRNEDGSIRGFLKIGQDVSDRRNAQEALEASERRMRSLATGIPQLVFRSNGSGERIWGSPQWIEFTGLSFDESLGLGWLEKVHPDDRKATMEAWQGVEERGEYYVEHRIFHAATGEWPWHQTRAAPLRDDEGKILEWLGSSTDVQELRELQRHQQTLLAELQHRVRNTLGVVRSIARRTAERSSSVEELSSHFQGRLDAFSRVQTIVTRNPDSGVDLASLIEDELLAHAAREGEALQIEGPAVSLKARAAESLSLAVHELATNAVKYGALGNERGRIAIRWERLKSGDKELLRLVWEENGVEMPAEPPARRGFGLELLQRSLPYDLRAETQVRFRPEGLRFEMKMPLGPDVLAE